MKLEKFKEKDTKKKGIILFTISCMLLIIGVYFSSSFALFETKEVFNLIEGNIEDIGDLSFTYYIDDQIALASPEKNSGKAFDSSGSYCTNDANIRWDYEEWGAVVTNIPSTKTKCFLKFKTEYSEEILNGTDPVLKEGLIPVTIEADGTVKKADRGSKWYSYQEKIWANAVILKDEHINYKENEIIPEDNIESYFVWIPRYRYKIFNEGNYTNLTANVVDNLIENKAQIIEVNFETKDLSLSTGATKNTWLTHPAFQAFDSNGMWVGKFETSKGNNELDNSINPDGVQIKPNVTAWRAIQTANAFYTSYHYKRNLESHMMKNTEWGAVAYLQHSEYGSHTSVRVNNNNSHITGYAAKKEPTCGFTGTNLECNEYCNDGSCNEPYNTPTGNLASTTGNIIGIYDMSGGSWETVMAVMLDKNGNPLSGKNDMNNSGFIGGLSDPSSGNNVTKTIWTNEDGGYVVPDKRYYDTYFYGENKLNYERGHLGDATKEMGPFGLIIYDSVSGTSNGSANKVYRNTGSWYMDTAQYYSKEGVWLNRGGRAQYGIGAGIFTYYAEFGMASTENGFRIVLI